ncbi:MAG: GNAT family N-acetyltransferase [Abditibacteriales bacterium]|nr:GNAT family N-acetyltransferase [Abditibacteriales bacterium]
MTLKNGRAITVRCKTPDDGEALGEMLASCSERTYYFFHPYPLTRESGLKVAADDSIVCFIAFAEDGTAVGYVWIGREGEMPTLGICVRDSWQEVGVGRALMERMIAEAKNLGKKGIQLTVMKDNARGIALYQSVGFVIDGDAPDPVGPSYHMTLGL